MFFYTTPLLPSAALGLLIVGLHVPLGKGLPWSGPQCRVQYCTVRQSNVKYSAVPFNSLSISIDYNRLT